MNENLGKKNIFRIYLTCSPRERAMRFIERNFGKNCAEYADKNLPLAHKAYEVLPLPTVLLFYSNYIP
jgi:hypothetical protein